MRPLLFAESLATDLLRAFRLARRGSGFSIVFALCLGLGVGVNVVLFGVIDVLLFRAPAAVTEPESLVRVELGSRAGRGPLLQRVLSAVTYPQYRELHAHPGPLADVAAYAGTSAIYADGTSGIELRALHVSANYFSLLGTQPVRGRFFAPDDTEADVIIVSHTFWRTHLNSSTAAVGSRVRVNGVPLTVIGVAPPDFVGVDLREVDAWLPFTLVAADEFGGAFQLSDAVVWIRMIARLPPGVDRRQAMAAPIMHITPDMSLDLTLTPIASEFGSEFAGKNPVPVWLLGITLALLLIACVTVANLLLARASVRGHEIATRLSLGATRARIMRQLTVESLVLGMFASAVALVFALSSVLLLQYLPLPPMRNLIDGNVAAMAIIAALITTILCGVMPAWWATRSDLAEVLKGNSANVTRPFGIQRVLLGAQIACSVVLLVCAGLFVRSLNNLEGIDTGFAHDRLLEVRLGRPLHTTSLAQPDYFEELLARVRTIPGVVAATRARAVPFHSNTILSYEIPDGRAPDAQPSSIRSYNIDAEYMKTLGLRVIAGRNVTPAEVNSSNPPVLISKRMQDEFFHGNSALGACLRRVSNTSTHCATIVGIVSDAKYTGLRDDVESVVYRAQNLAGDIGSTTFFVRTEGDPARFAAVVRQAIVSASGGNLPLVTAEPLLERVAPELIPWRVASRMFGFCAALATILASIGLFSVVSLATLQRSREFAIRVAVGARARDIVTLVIGQSVGLTAAGLGIGICVSLAVSRLFKARMYGIHAMDPATYGAVVVLLAAVALLASWIPAHRAAVQKRNI